MENHRMRREGRAVFMCWESGEGLCRPTLPDRGDAKPGAVDTSTQIKTLELVIAKDEGCFVVRCKRRATPLSTLCMSLRLYDWLPHLCAL